MMKKTILKSALLVMASGLIAGNAIATPLLNELTMDDGITVLLPTSGSIADSGAEAVTLTDTDGTNDTAVSTLYFHYAGYYSNGWLDYGIYGYTENIDGSITLGETLDLFTGDYAATSILFDLANGTATAQGITANIGTNFGFYLTNTETQNTFYTHNFLNTDNNFDHALIYDTSSITTGDFRLVNSDVIVAFEDLYGGGDGDYNDFVFGVSDVAPVPEPATMLLFGTGLAGLAGLRRKKSQKA